MLFFPLAALGMAASMLVALPAALFIEALQRKPISPRCPVCEAERCAECVDLNRERERRFRRRSR